MKLTELQNKTIKPLQDIVAFKWIKGKSQTKSGLIIPELIYDQSKEGRMGHKFTCEVIAVGPDCKYFKPKERFVLHEYNKIDQGIPWEEEDIMFCHEKYIAIKVSNNYNNTELAEPITEDLIKHYATEDNSIDDSAKVVQSREDLQGPEWSRKTRH
jgi:co-chaperonin GroES (HSP10)